MKYRRRWDFFWLAESWKEKYRAIGIDPVNLEKMENNQEEGHNNEF